MLCWLVVCRCRGIKRLEAGIGYQTTKLLNTTQLVVFTVYISDKPNIDCVLLACSNIFPRLLKKISLNSTPGGGY